MGMRGRGSRGCAGSISVFMDDSIIIRAAGRSGYLDSHTHVDMVSLLKRYKLREVGRQVGSK